MLPGCAGDRADMSRPLSGSRQVVSQIFRGLTELIVSNYLWLTLYYLVFKDQSLRICILYTH
jgi:hypothetical protein